MKYLKDILYKTALREISGSTGTHVRGITMDSRMAKKDWVFVAIRGTRHDGHSYITDAVRNGASVIICEKIPVRRNRNTVFVSVENAGKALGIIASNYFGNPSEKMNVIGITGTNGKTTVATLLHNLFTSLGYKSGLISTVVYKIVKKEILSTHTTPDSLSLNNLFSQMLKAGCTHCFMEVSSHALVQGRIIGTKFSGAIFTNLTHDHLDYHRTFREYRDAKKILFDSLPAGAFALVNADDRNCRLMVQNTKAKISTYAISRPADFKSKLIENSFEGLCLDIEGKEVWFRLPGRFNASNLTAAYSVACLLGEERSEVLVQLSRISGAPGRFEIILSRKDSPRGITGIVDYAHTPDALKNTLETIREVHGSNGKIITVIGCGGDRDKSKRPLMARIACEMSDRAIFTTDNPRSEDPSEILSEMEKGVPARLRKNLLTVPDRRNAIKTAVQLSLAKDVVLVAGKGHESYQEIKGKKYPFSDKKILSQLLTEK